MALRPGFTSSTCSLYPWGSDLTVALFPQPMYWQLSGRLQHRLEKKSDNRMCSFESIYSNWNGLPKHMTTNGKRNIRRKTSHEVSIAQNATTLDLMHYALHPCVRWQSEHPNRIGIPFQRHTLSISWGIAFLDASSALAASNQRSRTGELCVFWAFRSEARPHTTEFMWSFSCAFMSW